MHDTDRVVRQPRGLQYIDLTPTTAPSWSMPPVARLARGTMLPPVARPVDLEGAATTRFERIELEVREPAPKTRRATPKLSLEEAMELGVREVAMPRRWGRVLAVGLDGELAPVPAPARIASPRVPLLVQAALLAVIMVLLAVALGVWARVDAPAPAAASPEPQPVGAPSVVTTTPLEPIAAVEPAAIEMPAIGAPAPKPAAKKPAPLPVGMTGGEGSVMISSKPPCRILVDGKDTGLRTPTRDLRLPAGEHEITLVNDEFGIEDRSTISVNAGAPAKLVRDLTAKLPAP